ncbi:MAG: 3-dehydroquinate dehydratase [Ignavibacteriales bacterium CG07_land_8_20_14_0_80_59_12]|nr:MAG: 3-dehydroquinate dehydratase [Ignavibacteriales bacterium CG07_land_8_20_14_0_80_59_12]
MNCIEIKRLRKTYKKNVVALWNLDLNVPAGCIFGFVGPNGAGKSTTINIMAGIIPRDSGEIFILGGEIDEDDYKYKRNVGFILEKPHFIEKLTAKEYLEFVATMYKIDKVETQKRVNELLEFFELEEKRNDWIETYSAGMKKKVSLAAATIHNPKLLILDEPLEGIDPVSAKDIKDMLKMMKEKGTTIFLSSHNLDMVEKLCEEVAIMNKGKIVFQSKTKDIRKKLKDEVSQETYSSLEEIFIDIVSEENQENRKKALSWL